MQVDLHQHLWPAPFVAALRARREPPRLDGLDAPARGRAAARVRPGHARRRGPGGPRGRRRSRPGVHLPRRVARHRPAARGRGRRARGRVAGGRARAARALRGVDAGAHARRRSRTRWRPGRSASSSPADRLAAPGALADLAPLLGTLEAADRPLFVHPGPAGDTTGRPVWWGAVVPYVAQLHAAWWAWADGGRERFPRPARLLRGPRRGSARCTASATGRAAARHAGRSAHLRRDVLLRHPGGRRRRPRAGHRRRLPRLGPPVRGAGPPGAGRRGGPRDPQRQSRAGCSAACSRRRRRDRGPAPARSSRRSCGASPREPAAVAAASRPRGHRADLRGAASRRDRSICGRSSGCPRTTRAGTTTTPPAAPCT